MNIFEKNRIIFETLERYLESFPDDFILESIQIPLDYALRRPTTYYSSKILEESLYRISLNSQVSKDRDYNKILILYTSHEHSSCQKAYYQIAMELQKRFTTYSIDLNKVNINNIDQLRQGASCYRCIFYIGQSRDIIPILAFSKNFTIPIIYYNVCNYLFCLGNSIADVWVDISEDDKQRSIKKRGLEEERIKILPLQGDYKPLSYNPTDRIKIYSCGGWHKYIPIDNNQRNFFTFCKKLLDSNSYIDILISGVDEPQNFYRDSIKNIHPRLQITKHVSHKDHIKYLESCDIFLDSYPINGYTSCIEARSYGKPVASLRSKGGSYLDTHKNTIFDTQEELIEWINHGNKTLEYGKYRDTCNDKWSNILYDIIDTCPKDHILHNVTSNVDNNFIDFDYNIALEKNLHYSILFNRLQIPNIEKYRVLQSIQEFSKRNNKGLI